jgi:thiosulfate dehydrogenase [quinone] large subunit
VTLVKICYLLYNYDIYRLNEATDVLLDHPIQGGIMMATVQDLTDSKRFVKRLEEPPVARSLFGDVRWAWIWLALRLYVGYEWLHAGWGKLNNDAWVGSRSGTALAGFANGALKKTGGQHPDVQGWYAWFLRHIVLTHTELFSYMVTFGEVLVGIALILGIFTGIAALFGSFMNMNYLLAGSVSTTPILFIIAIWLVLAWRTAGWWGLDRWALPALGTPWRPGFIFQEREGSSRQPARQPAGSED